jgi:predicted porin
VKRLLVAAGLALATSAPAHALEPDVNLSGVFGLGASYFHSENSGDAVNLANNGSNFRLSGAIQEVNLRAFMAYERGAANDRVNFEEVREFFGGVSTPYGTILYGLKSTDYKLAGQRLDPFYNTSVAGYTGTTDVKFASPEPGASFGLSPLTNGFTSSTVAYRTASLAGFTGNIGGYVHDNTPGSNQADYGGGIGYANSEWLGLDAGVQFLDINAGGGPPAVAGAPGKCKAYRLHSSVGEKLWAAGLSLEVLDVDAEAKPRKYGYLSGSYQVAQDWRLALAYGHVQDTDSALVPYDGDGVTAGAFYDLARNLTTYAAARYVKLNNGTKDKTISAAIGVKFTFDVNL